MKVIELSSTLGQEPPYIVGLQTELPFGKRDLAQLAKNTKVRARTGDLRYPWTVHQFHLRCLL